MKTRKIQAYFKMLKIVMQGCAKHEFHFVVFPRSPFYTVSVKRKGYRKKGTIYERKRTEVWPLPEWNGHAEHRSIHRLGIYHCFVYSNRLDAE